MYLLCVLAVHFAYSFTFYSNIDTLLEYSTSKSALMAASFGMPFIIWGTCYLNLAHTSYLVDILANLIVFRMLFHCSNHLALFLSGSYIFAVIAIRGVIVSTYALTANLHPSRIYSDIPIFTSVVGIAILISIILLTWVVHTKGPNKTLQSFAKNEPQIRHLAWLQLCLLGYLVYMNDGRFYTISSQWFSGLYLITSLICLGIMAFTILHVAQISTLREYEKSNEALEYQLNKQLRHYTSFQEYAENFRRFRHDFNQSIGTVKNLINNNQNSSALNLIGELQTAVESSSLQCSLYSNNTIVDAILFDAAKQCETVGISFSAQVIIPESLHLSDLDTVRILTNVLKNAVEASETVDKGSRFITVSSRLEGIWFSIIQTNRFFGPRHQAGGLLKTTKSDTVNHGLGLKIVNDRVEALGGFIHLNANNEQGLFTLRIHLPISGPK